MSLKPPAPPNAVVYDETTGLAYRDKIAFVGDAVTVTDDSANGRSAIAVRAVPALNVKDPPYNAKGDGVTDDSAALIAAYLDGMAQKRRVFHPTGRYIATANLLSGTYTDGVEICGEGRSRSTILHNFAASNGPALFTGGGTVGAAVLLTASAARGDNVLTVASTTGISVGDNLALRDLNQHYWDINGADTGVVEGEVVRVKSVDSSTQLTLKGALEENYTLVSSGGFTNNNCDIRLLTLISGMHIHDLGFEDVSGAAGGPNIARAIGILKTLNMRLERLKFKNFSADSVRVEWAVDYDFSDLVFQDSSDNNGYGVQSRQGCSGILRQTVMRTGRHLFTTDASTNEIPPRHIDVVNCKVFGNSLAGFDTHAPGKYIRFIDCEDNGHYNNASDSSSTGFQVRAPYVSIINPRVVGGKGRFGVSAYPSAVGFRLQGGSINALNPVYIQGAEDSSVTGVKLYPLAAAADAIRVERPAISNVPSFDNLLIDGVDIVGDAGTPTTNGLNFISWGAGFIHRNIRSRNVTNQIVGSSQANGWRPTNAIAETMQRLSIGTATGALTTGTLRLSGGLVLPAGQKVTSITVVSGTTALSVGSNQWFALFDKSLNKLAITSDDTSAGWGTNTAKTLNLASPYTPVVDMEVYIGVLVVATTPPTVNTPSLSSAVVNLAPVMGGNSTAALTNPASCPSPVAALSGSNPPFYAYVS